MSAGTDPEVSGSERDPWRLLDLGRCEPYVAQTFAESVAVSVATGESPNTLILAAPATPYLSLGFHQSYEEEIDEAFLRARNVPVIRRVTGGGTTWLDPDQLFYQLVYRDDALPGGSGGPADLGRFLRGPVRCLRSLGVRAELRPPSDLVVAGRKISGNAGGDWEGAHLLVGGFLGRADLDAMAGALRSPHPVFASLLRREMGDRISSLERETAGPLAPERWGTPLVAAFEAEGLFRVRRGTAAPSERRRFESEVRPRHLDPGWFRLPPPPRRTSALVRRVRVAGSRFVVAIREDDATELVVGVVDGGTTERAWSVATESAGSSAEPETIEAADPRRALLAAFGT